MQDIRMRILAQEPTIDLGKGAEYKYRDGNLIIYGNAVIDDELYKWDYEHPNIFKPDLPIYWNVVSEEPADEKTRDAVWNSFVENILPYTIMDLSNKLGEPLPKKFVESIPALKDWMDLFKIEHPPEGALAGGMVDWDNVDKPGWQDTENENKRDGLFKFKDPKTKKMVAYPFSYTERVKKRENGTVFQDKPKITWHQKPKVPKRMRQDYERIILGEVAREATAEMARKGLLPAQENIPKLTLPVPEPMARPDVRGQDKNLKATPEKAEPVEEATKEKARTKVGDMWKPIKVTPEEDDWQFDDDGDAYQIFDIDYMGRKEMKQPITKVKVTWDKDKNRPSGYAPTEGVMPLDDEDKMKEWETSISDLLFMPDFESQEKEQQAPAEKPTQREIAEPEPGEETTEPVDEEVAPPQETKIDKYDVKPDGNWFKIPNGEASRLSGKVYSEDNKTYFFEAMVKKPDISGVSLVFGDPGEISAMGEEGKKLTESLKQWVLTEYKKTHQGQE